MSQQYQPRAPQRPGVSSDAHEAAKVSPRAAAAKDAFDAVLDEIDAVLEADAEAFVKGFVQKGGQ